MRAAVGLCLLLGCAPGRLYLGSGLPADLGEVSAPAEPTHALRVAILPLVDGRAGADGAEPDEIYVYRGTTYRATQAGASPAEEFTEIVAAHLAKSRVFAQVILVSKKAQAPEADLFLEGRLHRLRGYVEADAPSKESGRPADERQILAEVLIKELRLRDRDGKLVLDVDAGWSIVDARRYPAGVEPDPWSVLGEALRTSVDGWIAFARTANLSGVVEIHEKVALAETTSSAVGLEAVIGAVPKGWAATTSTTALIGWKGPPACRAVILTQRQTRRFHRALGPYRPTVTLWACPAGGRYRFDGQAEYAAHFLGTSAGELYFALALGQSNWSSAEAELTERLGLVAPEKRHLFEVGGAAPH